MSDDPQKLLNACLKKEPFAWERFVDRFLPLLNRVVEFELTEIRPGGNDDAQRKELVEGVFRRIQRDDYDVLRKYDEKSGLATYLTVIAQRYVHAHSEAG